ncbi:3,4-dihydroxy-2-butanone-4-phosphate synthase [Nocardia alni]|uniref:3,4-dihydroxy-2-butanone-4-phosphate synthase n=1 Tax=Nocardia alni TaxID=2815723 RepID=UPI001C222E0D|nr:3,4-dihydroxy-2-butanone-4-phosphate synthase [Nocardia alni]
MTSTIPQRIPMPDPALDVGDTDVERAAAEIAAGRAVVVIDDRRDEAALVFAAQCATSVLVAFAIRYGSGMLCVPMTGARLDALLLPPMCGINQNPRGAAYTVSVDASDGVSTGISAIDRARTIRLLAADDTHAEQLSRPGHVLPLRARPGGVLERPGHTEAAIELTAIAAMRPAGVVCEILNDDGTLSRGADLDRFCTEHGLHRLTITDLVRRRAQQAPRSTTLITRHRVRDFDSWRSVFGGHQDNRRAHGATGHRIFRLGDEVTVLTEFPNRAAAERFLADPALREIVARAGFLGSPETRICELVDDEAY